MATKPAAESPLVYMVLESFVVELDGAPVVYRRGEPIHPDDPVLKRWPARFGPLEFPHSFRRRSLATPQVRSE